MSFSPIAVAAGLSLLVVSASASASTEPTPAQERITQAETRVANNPASADAWSELAFSFARRARETADATFYARADEALRRAFDISPANLEAKKVKAWVLLGQHEFEAALKLAEELHVAVPDDIQIYGYLVDANAELGRYGKAEEAAQWMLNLRPGNVPGLTRAAYLRELFGDVEGAIELMALAYELVSPTETEDRAWILTQIAHLNVLVGRREAAGALVAQALELFPDYHYALAQLARVRSGEGRRDEAVSLLEKRYARAPHPENLYELAVALEAAGRSEAARAAFADFEQKARAEMSSNDNANRELAFYLADQGGRPEEALRVAEREAARRRDVTTLEALAWSLYRSGRHEDAGRRSMPHSQSASGTRGSSIAPVSSPRRAATRPPRPVTFRRRYASTPIRKSPATFAAHWPQRSNHRRQEGDRGARPGLGIQADHRPAVALSAIEQPVVQPVLVAVPELDTLWPEPIAAPERRPRDLRMAEAQLRLVIAIEQLATAVEGGALTRDPGRDAMASRPAGEIIVRLDSLDLLDTTLRPHLGLEGGPVEAERGLGVGGEVAALRLP